MNRSTLDKLISWTGLIVAVVMLAASGGLFYAHNFVHNEVQKELSAQKITFPPAGNAALTSLPTADQAAMDNYAGQQMVNGKQAETYADHFIAVHLIEAGGGKTYAQLSTASLADPSNTKLAGQVQTLFKGETLRGLLLNAYAFDTMATVAHVAAFGTLIAGLLLLLLVAMGFSHATKVSSSKRRK